MPRSPFTIGPGLEPAAKGDLNRRLVSRAGGGFFSADSRPQYISNFLFLKYFFDFLIFFLQSRADKGTPKKFESNRMYDVANKK